MIHLCGVRCVAADEYGKRCERRLEKNVDSNCLTKIFRTVFEVLMRFVLFLVYVVFAAAKATGD